jgi:uncharacterized protein (TIGR02466 family)
LSNLGGYQSNDLKFNLIFLPLLKLIEIEANHLASNIEIKNNLKIDNFWLNVNAYRDLNKCHTHPHSILSGSFYVETPKNCGSIVFRHPYHSIIEMFWNNHTLKYNKFNSTIWEFFPSEGQLLIFPSWLEHYVEPNMNEKKERISISFNLK